MDIVLSATDAPVRIFPWVLERPLFNVVLAEQVGLALIGIALILFLFSLSAFGNSWRIGIDRENPGELVMSGVFSISRNPIFLSMDLLLLGTFLVIPSIVYLCFMGILFVGIHLQILEEEKFLRSEYGETYSEYLRSTCRYLGRKKGHSSTLKSPLPSLLNGLTDSDPSSLSREKT